MSQADQIFVHMCEDILENGTTTEGQKVRPHWPDGTPAYTIKRFGVCSRYDLSKEFPALTLRKTAVKLATDEMLWIVQRKSNNIHDLHSHVWDEWADETGSIGKAYGYQMALKNRYTDITKEGLEHAFGDGRWGVTTADPDSLPVLVPANEEEKRLHAIQAGDGSWYMDQTDRVIYDLKNNPFSRRIMTNYYNFADLSEMHLYPCAYSMTFNVTQKKGDDRLTLNAVLSQRSQDTLAANNWNVVQYSVLVYMLAQVCDMRPGEFVHMIADAHIYDRHVDVIKELIRRPQYPAPQFHLNPDVHDFYAFTKDDVVLENYQHGEQIKDIPIAI
ncbi:MAG: thymidylate synthase [Lachnospiraceae bacterium]|nr:thymidylate synthase [Lachnospiraceae bacterium]